MPKTWKEVLQDKATYGDDFTVALKDGQTMTLGDMRSYDRENEGALTAKLTARETELSKREKNVNDAAIQLGTVIEKTAERAGLSVEDFLSGKTPTKRAVAAAADLDENDPLVGTLVKKINAMQSKMDEQSQAIERTRKDVLGPVLNTYLDDYYESRWEDKIAPSLPKGAKVTREQVMEHANKNGLKDSKGRLDLARAAKELTFDARVEVEAEKKAESMRQKMEDERTLAAAPRPNSLGQRTKTAPSLQKQVGTRLETKNFDDVLNDALTDTDLWRSVGTA